MSHAINITQTDSNKYMYICCLNHVFTFFTLPIKFITNYLLYVLDKIIVEVLVNQLVLIIVNLNKFYDNNEMLFITNKGE